MERRKLAAVCGAALCFWLFALAVGTSQGVGLNTAFHTSPMNAALVSAPAPAAAPAQEGVVPVQCRAAVLIDQGSGTVLYEKNPDQPVPIASITKVMTLLLTFEAVHEGRLNMQTMVPVSEHAYSMGSSLRWMRWSRLSVSPRPMMRR